MDNSRSSKKEWTIEHHHLDQTRYDKFARQHLNDMCLPTINQIREGAHMVPKTDTSRNWIALEYLIVYLLAELSKINNAHDLLTGDTGVSVIRNFIYHAWHTNLVSCFFPLSSFKNRWVGILTYILARLETGHLTPTESEFKSDLIYVIERELSLHNIRHPRKASK